ncbi:MAG: Thioredoxin reductase (EC [uncultured Paraburkholderia sp.]|nr:MAG: Thioredoxin reductase (EC [uncultured Paraburkholderia sp.]CAH2913337.1 MAG: Thioredoxin reductase (EC [uncultured Paraburkholderia sp.]
MHQMFPALTCAEIERLRRFGEVGQWNSGELLFETGYTGPGPGHVRTARKTREGVSARRHRPRSGDRRAWLPDIFWPRSASFRDGPRS